LGVVVSFGVLPIMPPSGDWPRGGVHDDDGKQLRRVAVDVARQAARQPHTVSAELEFVLLTDRDMVNSNRNRKNQPPTGEGKHQAPFRGEPRKLDKRSDVVQAQRHHPELNLGDASEEAAHRDGDQPNSRRPKAGR
jgi:hypothetical protein